MSWQSAVLWWGVLYITSVSPLLAVAAPPTDPQQQATMDVEQERQRFAHLQRKGVIEVQRAGPRGTLRISIEPLVWGRLTLHEQQNFLQRAQRFFGGSVVEMHSRHKDNLLARLAANGDFESFTTPAEERARRDNPALESPPTPPAASGRMGQGR